MSGALVIAGIVGAAVLILRAVQFFVRVVG